MPSPQPKLEEAIKNQFSNDHLSITNTQWLISAKGTVVDITAKLGIYDPKNTDLPINGSAVVFATSSYNGRAPTVIWDWIKSKLEANPNAAG